MEEEPYEVHVEEEPYEVHVLVPAVRLGDCSRLAIGEHPIDGGYSFQTLTASARMAAAVEKTHTANLCRLELKRGICRIRDTP